MRYLSTVLVYGLVLCVVCTSPSHIYAQTNTTTVESRYGGIYDAQIANQNSWIDGLSVVNARDYGADLIVSGAVVSTFGSLTAWAFSSAFDAGIANFAPNTVTPFTYVGIGTVATIGIFGLSMVVGGIVNVIMADQILIADEQ